MNAPAGSQIRLVIVGATGMVGGYALRYALDHPSVGVVTVIGRKTLDISHPKLRQVLHRDFADCSALAQSLSGQDAALFCLGVYTGAEQTEQSRVAFARYKGKAEKELLAAGFPRLYVFRPAYIYPVESRKEPNFSYRLLRAIYPLFRVLFPNQVIPADDLARAMVDVAVRETGKTGGLVFENGDIRAMVK